MQKGLIWIIIVVVAAGLGVGAAMGIGRLALAPVPWAGVYRGSGSENGMSHGMVGRFGMMGQVFGNPSATGHRISIDKAIELAKQYASNYGNDLQVSEVMEFSENFYAVVKEANTGRGAFEILVDPYTGAIYPEPGPNMMWNAKYSSMGGMMGGLLAKDNTLTIDQAVQAGQKYLNTNIAGAKLETDGISFYGHYTFDYQAAGGMIAGMLSVNGVTGAVWLHTWHGDFIQEKEVK